TGACTFSRWFPGDGARPHTIAADASSRIYVGGSYGGSIDLGGGPIPGAGQSSTFVAALDGDGMPRWGRGFTNVGANGALDAAGTVFLAGVASGMSNLGVGEIDGAHTPFVAGLDPLGAPRWAKGLATSTPNGAFGAVAAGTASGVVIAGGISGTIDLGCGP